MAEQQSIATRVARGALAGGVAGVAASFAMDRVQALASALSGGGGAGETTTSRAADAVARGVTGAELPAANKPLGGQGVHYAVGTLLGVAYGVAAEFRPGVTLGSGAAFGTATALLLDEAAVPAAGLGDAPWNSPPTTHLYALASHLVFGIAAERVRRIVDGTLSAD